MKKNEILIASGEEHIDLNTTIDNAIADLLHVKEQYITDDVTYHMLERLENGYIKIWVYRTETDEEFNARLKEHVNQLEGVLTCKGSTLIYEQEDEYDVYLMLKEKYENQ